MTRYAFPITLLVFVLVFILVLTGCQQATVISALEAAVTAAEIAIPVIAAATGLNPAIAEAIVVYLREVNLAAGQASTILAGPGTPAQKAAEVIQAFARVAAGCNCVPPGTPAEVIAVVNAVAAAVVQFLEHFPPKKAAPPHVKVTPAATAALAQIRTRALNNVAKLEGGIKK